MVRLIRFTNAANDVIRGASANDFQQTGFQLPGGDWMIPLNEETWGRLEAHILPGETPSDTVIRLVTLAQKGLQ